MNRNYDPFVTKAFSLLKHLHLKYGFSLIKPKIGRQNDLDEYWIMNENDPHYQLIRITSKKASDFKLEEQRIRLINEVVGRQIGKVPSFLDIHVTEEAYEPSFEEYDYMNLEYEFHNGVDVHEFYPEIYTALRDKIEANTVGYAAREGIEFKKERSRQYTSFKACYVTYILMIICIILYIGEVILTRRYDDASAYIIMGADYKTFTLGLKQYYRLFTCAFLHGSFIHILSNMYSLFIVGHTVERILGKAKYIFLLSVSILISSLSQGIMTDNSLLLGMSGGIYGLFTYLLMFFGKHGQLRMSVLLPTILLNVYLNFLSSTAWIAHIGGIIAGMIVFMICNNKDRKAPIALLCIVVVFMLYRYLTIKTINPFYIANDMEVANIYYEWGLKDYSVKLVNRLLEVYQKFGG